MNNRICITEDTPWEAARESRFYQNLKLKAASVLKRLFLFGIWNFGIGISGILDL